MSRVKVVIVSLLVTLLMAGTVALAAPVIPVHR